MEISIAAKVIIDQIEPVLVRVVIRKVEFERKLDGGARVVAKYGLSQSGEWILIPDSQRYPDECILPVVITDNTNEP